MIEGVTFFDSLSSTPHFSKAAREGCQRFEISKPGLKMPVLAPKSFHTERQSGL